MQCSTFSFTVNLLISFLDCQNNFEFSHQGFFKDPHDTNKLDQVQMLNINQCACACYDNPTCVAYVFYSNNDCYTYKSFTDTDPENNAEAYIKKKIGDNYLLIIFNSVIICLLKIVCL